MRKEKTKVKATKKRTSEAAINEMLDGLINEVMHKKNTKKRISSRTEASMYELVDATRPEVMAWVNKMKSVFSRLNLPIQKWASENFIKTIEEIDKNIEKQFPHALDIYIILKILWLVTRTNKVKSVFQSKGLYLPLSKSSMTRERILALYKDINQVILPMLNRIAAIFHRMHFKQEERSARTLIWSLNCFMEALQSIKQNKDKTFNLRKLQKLAESSFFRKGFYGHEYAVSLAMHALE